MVVYPEDIFYQMVKPEDVPHLVEEHFIKGRPVQKFLYTPPAEKKTIPVMNEIPFFKHQVLGRSGTGASSTPRRSKSTSPATATWPPPRRSRR